MRAGKFVMLMYTIRTMYTLLILLGFSLKNAAPSDPDSECRRAPRPHDIIAF